MLVINNMQLKHPITLLNKSNLVIKNRQITGILGDSGTGKTTLLHEIALLGYHQFESYVFNDTDVHTLSDNDKNDFLRNNISFITQDIYLLDKLTVRETIEFYMMLNNVEYDCEDICQLLDYVNLDIDLSTSVNNLSGGERQRLYIACELIKDSQLYIFDEPFAYLDQNNINILFEVIKKLAYEKNKMVIISTHNHNIVHNFDCIYKIYNHELNLVKGSDDNYLNGNLNNCLLSFKPLKYYVSLNLKYNKWKVITMSILLSVLLAITLFISNYTDNFQKYYGESLINLLNNELTIISVDGHEITPRQYDYIDKMLIDYKIVKNLQTKDFNDVVLCGYLPEHFNEKDCYENIISEVNIQQSDIYVSYSLHRKMKEAGSYSFINNDFSITITPSKVLFPSVADKLAIYIPYNQYLKLLESHDINMSFVNTDSIVVPISSIDDINKIDNALPINYKIVEMDELSMSIRATQLFNNDNISKIVIFIILFVLFYKIYEIMNLKKDIILLKIQGIPNKMIIITKIYQEIFGLILCVATTSASIILLFLLFNILLINSVITSLLYVVLYNTVLYVFVISIYAISICKIKVIKQSRRII